MHISVRTPTNSPRQASIPPKRPKQGYSAKFLMSNPPGHLIHEKFVCRSFLAQFQWHNYYVTDGTKIVGYTAFGEYINCRHFY